MSDMCVAGKCRKQEKDRQRKKEETLLYKPHMKHETLTDKMYHLALYIYYKLYNLFSLQLILRFQLFYNNFNNFNYYNVIICLIKK